VVSIGTSTGGTQALEAVLIRLPRTAPGIVVVQHMPENFTKAFAERLNSVCQIKVKEAAENDRILPGQALIAPGGRHMLVSGQGSHARVSLKDGPPVSRHRPSVDVLFRSTAKSVGRNALGIIMTGMGDDGASGLKEMHDTGARTLGQNEATCVVYGMPAVAMKRGAVDKEIDLDVIPDEIMAFGKA
ncbi:MAG: chemotaxis response regulator protein-glutamate methylesterase, partial [Gammaproteobacteria bacterium]|nr:chemotaxis response regulator protein-glutamate methylesterase [Gammaproteobacteria bacterium]